MYRDKSEKRTKGFPRPQKDFKKNPPTNKVKFVRKANMWLAYYWKTEGGKLIQKNNWFNNKKEAEKFLEEHEDKSEM
jgi:hypothetical protein